MSPEGRAGWSAERDGLDAIRLAAAALFRQELTALATYDHRLLTGSREIGLMTASPGAAG